ncbi:PepSY-associated TM helix domain-containing protein [Aquisphaera insulae]|uniref:PepSY-associated TM helix domain-containing protein n=1 Tax=Aquisphaera insulae TaxID=2712864 RepID=UPI0013ED4893|nr:PepSY-associated TM helix domain-containing protein [Aquisphaera insulae]
MATTDARPFRRRLAIRFAWLARWLHVYASMLGLAVTLFFSVTGITLNHPDWFFGEQARTVQAEGAINSDLLHLKPPAPGNQPSPDLSAEVAKLEVVEALRKAHGIRGALVDFKVDEQECSVTFKGPGYSADAFIDRESGKYTLTESIHGLVAVLNDLHKGRDTGPAWSAVIDISAAVLVVISLTGLILLFYLKLRRIPGLIVALIGTIVVLAFYFWGVP